LGVDTWNFYSVKRLRDSLRTFLVLARVSNLPTVWSNCLAGWLLGGGGHSDYLPSLFCSASFLYIGGMFLNDAFDADFDREHRPERPIAAGLIGWKSVWRWGLTLVGLGVATLLFLGPVTAALGLALAICIILYDATHKLTPFAPILIATCRFLLYLVAASTGMLGVTGWAVWCGLALAFYVAGISHLARYESKRGAFDQWPLLILGAPIVLALIMDVNETREAGLLLSLILFLWSLRSLRYTLWSSKPEIGRTVSGLLAGVVFVDWLAVADAPRQLGLYFLGLFAAAILAQRYIPAT